MEPLTLHIADEAAMARLGQGLGAKLFPGAVVALVGPLGAGKTFLARAIAEGLGIDDARQVVSPTFVLHQIYAARLPIHHFDAYRLKSPLEFIDLGGLERFEEEGVCLAEWADRLGSLLPKDHLRIEIEPLADGSRRATLSATGPRHRKLIEECGFRSGRRSAAEGEG